eukprot:scaffold615363_cov90-Attheya_sp.AAC.1
MSGADVNNISIPLIAATEAGLHQTENQGSSDTQIDCMVLYRVSIAVSEYATASTNYYYILVDMFQQYYYGKKRKGVIQKTPPPEQDYSVMVESTKEGAKHTHSTANMRTSSLIPTNYMQVIVRGKNICIPRVLEQESSQSKREEAI